MQPAADDPFDVVRAQVARALALAERSHQKWSEVRRRKPVRTQEVAAAAVHERAARGDLGVVERATDKENVDSLANAFGAASFGGAKLVSPGTYLRKHPVRYEDPPLTPGTALREPRRGRWLRDAPVTALAPRIATTAAAAHCARLGLEDARSPRRKKV